jgi:class 3 adenylate cyclase
MSHILTHDSEISQSPSLLAALQGNGDCVSSLAPGEDLVTRWQEAAPDLLLLSLQECGETPAELIAQLRDVTEQASASIGVITRGEPEELLRQCLAHGATSLLAWPLAPVTLASQSHTLLQLRKARQEHHDLLQRLFPPEVASEIRQYGRVEPRNHLRATVVFTDFAGFTRTATSWSAEKLMDKLAKYFSYFDHVMDLYQLEKMKTIGDGYMFAGGLPQGRPSHAVDCVLASLELLRFFRTIQRFHKAQAEVSWNLRIGIHSGPLVAGLIGARKPVYDVIGDTVNTAKRLEESGIVGAVNISEETYHHVKEFFHCHSRGMISAKGKGRIKMYLVERLRSEFTDDKDNPNQHFWQTRAERNRR